MPRTRVAGFECPVVGGETRHEIDELVDDCRKMIRDPILVESVLEPALQTDHVEAEQREEIEVTGYCLFRFGSR